MNFYRFIGIIVIYFISYHGQAQTLAEMKSSRVVLPSGWALTPAGKSFSLGDLPLNIIVSPNKKLCAVTNNGQSKQSIQLIDLEKSIVADTKEIGKSWLGLAFGDNSNSLYVSGGNDNWILQFDIQDQKLALRDTFILGKPWPEKISIAGITVDSKKHILYAVTKENNSIYAIDLITKKILIKTPLGGEGYTCVLSPDRKILYTSCWGCDDIVLFDTEKQMIKNRIKVGDNPNEIILNKRGTLLYVANANDNSVSVIDLKRSIVIETLNSALYPNAPNGSTTNGLSLSDDEHTLFIANADNNCLAVFDVTQPGSGKSKGFIPVGWYPTCVRVVGKNIWVSNGKGFSSFPNPGGPHSKNADKLQTKESQYIGGLLKGTMSIVPFPDEKQLSIFSRMVYNNTPYNKEKEIHANGKKGNPVPKNVGDESPIKYVFYIIKENRTYDQVMSDLPGGNGDTTLLLFGESITPNQHALAKEFVLIDNFYVDGEVSADGHNWSTAAYATDYLEKNWPTSYGSRGGAYDGEGTRMIANNKEGFIWDLCEKKGITYRTYGEFADDYKPNIPAIENHFCKYFTSWDQSVRDTTRFHQWKRDFDSLLIINQVPSFNSLRFINDHTEGLSLGKPTPNAHVADNDLAVGMFVEYLSKSKIWKECAIFILEDDAQDGPDHVDAHRSLLYVAGGFVKHKFIDHTMYSTSSVLRTMELILGLPPMSQYDAAAEPMWRCFTDTVNLTPFKSLHAQIDISKTNTARNEWQRKSEKFDFRKEDRVPDSEFNQVLWSAIKGEHKICPPPHHAAFIKIEEKEDEE